MPLDAATWVLNVDPMRGRRSEAMQRRDEGSAAMRSLLDALASRAPHLRFQTRDGPAAGAAEPAAVVTFNRPTALVRIIRAPRGLGLARAFVAGDIDVDGDLLALAAAEGALRDPRLWRRALGAGLRTLEAQGVRALEDAGPTTVEYRRLRPGRHSIASDLVETAFHYDLSPAFYRELLGPSMAYSCAVFRNVGESLEAAQDRKHAMIAAKLELRPDSYVVDVGCGWGSFLRHAAQQIGCSGLGITASRRQAAAAQAALRQFRGMAVREGDYRQVLPVRGATAVTSIGMYEHVGRRNSVQFFRLVRRSLPHGARYLNQAIFRREAGQAHFRRNSFVERYVFPNAQLHPLHAQLRDLERAGFRVLHVESFGPSYAETTARWLANLRASRSRCVELEGEGRVRVWEMYLAGAHRRFVDGSIDVGQVLAEAR